MESDTGGDERVEIWEAEDSAVPCVYEGRTKGTPEGRGQQGTTGEGEGMGTELSGGTCCGSLSVSTLTVKMKEC